MQKSIVASRLNTALASAASKMPKNLVTTRLKAVMNARLVDGEAHAKHKAANGDTLSCSDVH